MIHIFAQKYILPKVSNFYEIYLSPITTSPILGKSIVIEGIIFKTEGNIDYILTVVVVDIS